VQRADNSWLVARLLADLYEQDPPHFTLQGLPAGLSKAYREWLERAGGSDLTRWRNQLRPVLTVLAAAGVGPVLPFALLVATSEALDGPFSQVRVRDVLADLRGLIIRQDPGAEGEQVGLFHRTLIDYLSDSRQPFSVDPKEGHQALLAAIGRLAPASEYGPKRLTPLQSYAAYHEAEHLWGAQRFAEIPNCLRARPLQGPAETLARWRTWGARMAEALGPDHPATLDARGEIADWTSEAGPQEEALRLYRELLPDMERALGKDDRRTLTQRSRHAVLTGNAGHPEEALRLLKELLPDMERALGKDDVRTLDTRRVIAYWTGVAIPGVLEPLEFRRLLDEEQRLRPDHGYGLSRRCQIALQIVLGGYREEGLRLLNELLPDVERFLGRDAPYTLHVRKLIASPPIPREVALRQALPYPPGEQGDPKAALRLLQALLPDMERVLGPDNPNVLLTRRDLADWTGRAGDSAEALRLYQELLPDYERVLGSDDRGTLITRRNIASQTGETGHPQEALRLLQELLPDCERVLGRDNFDTLVTRINIVVWTKEAGHPQEALRLAQELLPDLVRVLGTTHLKVRYFRELIARLS
jgi:hypothetical protein